MELAGLPRTLCKERSERNNSVGWLVFGEPAWDILLHLYSSVIENKIDPVRSARASSRGPYPTANQAFCRKIRLGIVIKLVRGGSNTKSVGLSQDAVVVISTYLRSVLERRGKCAFNSLIPIRSSAHVMADFERLHSDEGTSDNMNSLPLQRRLDGLSRDLEAVREALAVITTRIDAAVPGVPATPDAIARALLNTRRARREALGGNLFSDPAWDMLLALFAAEPGEGLSVSQLCASSAVAQTTALRWVDSLETAGLVTRALDPGDARRTLIALSPAARDKMRILLRRTVAALTGAGG